MIWSSQKSRKLIIDEEFSNAIYAYMEDFKVPVKMVIDLINYDNICNLVQACFLKQVSLDLDISSS